MTTNLEQMLGELEKLATTEKVVGEHWLVVEAPFVLTLIALVREELTRSDQNEGVVR